MGGNPLKKLGDGLATVVTGGLNKTKFGKKIGDKISSGLTLGLSDRSFGGGGGAGAAQAGGMQSPMDMLVNTGGAPLLANIAMGADIDDTLASFLGISKEQMVSALEGKQQGNKPLGSSGFGAMFTKAEDFVQQLSKEDIESIRGLRAQLTSVKTNTDLKNKAVNQLVQDFPNFMAQKVPEFAKLMDNETKQMMDSALAKVGANFASQGMLSSGATAEAAARAGADIGMQRLQYGTSLAGQDWQNQFNEANALRNFQMNMLGQQSQNGFNAVQNALQQNTQIGINNSQMQNQQNMLNQQNQMNQQNAMWQGLGQLGGTVVGGLMGGPFGASVGSQLGGSLGGMASGNSGYTSNPRLNLNYGFGGR